MNLETFRRIARQVDDLAKTGVHFDVSIQGDNSWSPGSTAAYFEPQFITVNSLKQLSLVQDILKRPIPLVGGNHNIKIPALADLHKNSSLTGVSTVWENLQRKPADKAKYPTLRFYSEWFQRQTYNSGLWMITNAPIEQLEDEVTYRFIGTSSSCEYCIADTHPLYNYLDQGFFLFKPNVAHKTIIITNELSVDTLLCLHLIAVDPSRSVRHLQHECYLNANLAKVLRIKLEKEISQHSAHIKRQYDANKEKLMAEFEKTVNAGLFEKISNGALPSGVFNSIKLTKKSATYETVSIEADNLLETLLSNTVFDERVDIYGLIRNYIQSAYSWVEEKAENALGQHAEPTPQPPAKEEDDADVGEDADAENQAQEENHELEDIAAAVFSINGINLTISRKGSNTRRYVNGIPINKIEVEEVCYRASCLHSQDEFDRFVRSVRDMSLRWHDALANGVGIKIHPTMTYDDYRNPKAPAAAPKLRFRKKDKEVHLVISEEKSVKIHLNQILRDIETINRKTNNGYTYNTGYGHRNWEWCIHQLKSALISACRHKRKVARVDAEGNFVRNDKNRKIYDTVVDSLLTETDVDFLTKVATEYHEKALEKSRLFLAAAVKATGAVEENWRGTMHYIVQGKLRKYAVNSVDNTVYNYERGNRICIVEPGHQVSVGGDATAARLYALKNDQAVISQIGTLQTA